MKAIYIALAIDIPDHPEGVPRAKGDALRLPCRIGFVIDGEDAAWPLHLAPEDDVLVLLSDQPIAAQPIRGTSIQVLIGAQGVLPDLLPRYEEEGLILPVARQHLGRHALWLGFRELVILLRLLPRGRATATVLSAILCVMVAGVVLEGEASTEASVHEALLPHLPLDAKAVQGREADALYMLWATLWRDHKDIAAALGLRPTDQQSLILHPPIMVELRPLELITRSTSLTIVIDRVLPRAVSLNAVEGAGLPRLRLDLHLTALGDGLCREGTRPHPEAEEGAAEERAQEDICSSHHTSLAPRLGL